MEWGGSIPSGPLGEEDVEELRSERSIRGLKSAEEIERLTVDENLGEIERAVLLLSSGLEIQKLSVVENLPKLLELNNSEVIRNIIPLLREFLYVAPIHIQLASSKIFQKIIENGIVQVYVFASSFLPIILHNIESRDISIANTWLEAILTATGYLPKDVIKREVLRVAISKGQLSQSVNSRLCSCKLLGQIAPRFDHIWIKKELMTLVTSLCQDVDYEVRACMCRQLESIAKALGLEATKTSVIPELVELTNDEEVTVRLAGLETITNLLTLLDDDTCTVIIVPLVRKFCENISQGDYQSLKSVARLFGKLCYGLSVNFHESQREWFLDYYRKMCHCGNPTEQSNRVGSVTLALQLSSGSSAIRIEDDDEAECRRCCAFNFPAMVLFADPSWFDTELAETFHSLVEDPHALVRRTVACGFHEVAKLLGCNVGALQQDLSILLKDESIEVLQGLIQNLPESLECLACGGHSKLSDTKLNNLSDLIPSLIACELAVASSSNWRLHVEILEKFSCFPKCLTSDQIYYKFVPLLFRLLSSNRVLPVKLAAARTLCIFIRYNRRFEQRQELCCRLIQECGRGKSYRNRQLFIDICKFVMELFSRNFFKENFFVFLLELASDPVINVRLKFCSVLPSLKSVLKLPSNRVLLQQLEQCVRRLVTSEQEPDVSVAIREAVMKLDKIEIITETLSRKTMFENDLMDQKKEEEEKQLIEMEEKEKEEMIGSKQGSEIKKKGKEDRSGKKGSKAVKNSKQETTLRRTASNKETSGSPKLKSIQKSVSSKSSSSSKGSYSPSLQKLPSIASTLPTISPTNTTSGGGGVSRKISHGSTTSSKTTTKASASGTPSKTKKVNNINR